MGLMYRCPSIETETFDYHNELYEFLFEQHPEKNNTYDIFLRTCKENNVMYALWLAKRYKYFRLKLTQNNGKFSIQQFKINF